MFIRLYNCKLLCNLYATGEYVTAFSPIATRKIVGMWHYENLSFLTIAEKAIRLKN